ncbi:MAG: flavodoxin domain-containing protein, partial [Clostridia bacterium]|nr:flavodoxin domain-containing protein [Clostridia bacterium]
MEISNNVKYIGVFNTETDLFEGQYKIPDGISYNSYVIIDEKIAVLDTVDKNFGDEWLKNLSAVLGDKKPDYLVVHHMEPDHSANIARFMNVYPEATIVSSAAAFRMMQNFFGTAFENRRLLVGENDELSLGKHTLKFIAAPMVHWPEVIMSYEVSEKILFSADGFGRFGSTDEKDDWADEARRYYIGIVGKYGVQVQAVLKKAAALEIAKICPLHGPVLTKNIGEYVKLYDIWSSYAVETDGTVIAYASVYGNTEKAAKLLAEKLESKGEKVEIYDLARTDVSESVAAAFRYGKLVLASITYNTDVFPYMKDFINHLTERDFKNRTVAFIENGSWAP